MNAVFEAPPARGAVVLVSAVGGAEGARPWAACLACAGSTTERAGLLVELDAERRPRPALVASSAARALEERLASHLPGVPVAARGSICHLVASPGSEGREAVTAALPLVRDGVAALPLPTPKLEDALETLAPDAALLRADLERDRALVALGVRGLQARGLRVSVAKRPLPWFASHRALFGLLPPGAPEASCRRVLSRLLSNRPDWATTGTGRVQVRGQVRATSPGSAG